MDSNIMDRMRKIEDGENNSVRVERAADDSNRTTPHGVFVQTFGCQMNVHDSQRILMLLAEQGYVAVNKAEDADVILINTCSVREKPAQKVLSTIGQYRELRAKKPGLIVGIGGCVAQQEGENLLTKTHAVDLVFGPDTIPELPQLLQRIAEQRKPIVATDFDQPGDARFLDIAPQVDPSQLSAMVTIMKGCDKYCSFCIVPYVRGRERYRPPAEILNEVRAVCAAGAREVMLLGQSVTSYRWKEANKTWKLSDLLYAVNGTSGLERLRFTAPYPRDFDKDLIDCYADGAVPSLCEHVHLPFQSGSNEILHRMNRRHSREQYLEWVAALRGCCPDIAIAADVIVGFPGESEADFEQTMDLIERVQFDQLFSFKYSPRPRTPARHKEQIDEAEKNRRLQVLQTRQSEISKAKNQRMEGTLLEVLVEGSSRRGSGQLSGRTRTNKIVNFMSDELLVGYLVDIHITNGLPHSLIGEFRAIADKDHHRSATTPDVINNT
jgi:tRNA-2-methylthio-N6-dimethylallyladenosine synthase